MSHDPDEEHGLERHSMWGPMLLLLIVGLVAFAGGIILTTALITHR